MIDTLKCHPLFRNCSIRAALPPQHQFTRQIFTKQILLTIYKISFNSVDSYFRPDLFQVCILNFWTPRCYWQLWGFQPNAKIQLSNLHQNARRLSYFDRYAQNNQFGGWFPSCKHPHCLSFRRLIFKWEKVKIICRLTSPLPAAT